MAVSATFRADFSQFQTAVAQAELKLKSFQTGAGQVEKALARVGNSFSGQQILKEATLAVKAIEGIGGVSKLTESEQQRLNSTLTEAVAKYKALGQTAPANLLAMEQATRGVEQATGGFGTTLLSLGKNILTTASGFFTAQAAFAAVKAVVRGVVDELKTLTIHGAAVDDVASNFDHLTAQSGRLGATLIGALRSGTHGTISDFDLMKLATQDLAAGLNLTDQQFGTLAKGAFALAQATGVDVATAMGTMNDAMLTGRTRSLALLTGKIDLEKAETAYAKSIGTTREHLSEEGKLEAARIATLQSVGSAVERLGEQGDGLDEKIAQAQATWTNFQNELGRTIATSPTILSALDGISKALTTAFGPEKGSFIRAIANLVDDAAIALVNFAKTAVVVAGGVVQEWYAVKKLYGDLAQIIDGVTLATLYLGKAQMTLPNAIGLGTDAYQKNDEAISRLLTRMDQRGKALQADDRAQAAVNDHTKGYIATLDGIVKGMETARDAATRHAQAVTTVGAATAGVNTGLARHSGLVKEDTEVMERSLKVTQKWAQIYEDMQHAGDAALQKMQDSQLKAATEGMQRDQELLLKRLHLNKEYVEALHKLDEDAVDSAIMAGLQISQAWGDAIDKSIKDAQDSAVAGGLIFEGMANKAVGAFGRMKQSWSDLLKGFTGGNGLSGFFTNLGDSILKGFGNVISGGLSSLISKGVGAAISGLGKLFGIGMTEGRKELLKANEEIKKLQAELLKTYGSLENIALAGGEAGKELVKAFGSQGPAGLERFQKLLGTFKDTIEEVDNYVGNFKKTLDDFADSGGLASGQMLELLNRARAAGGELGKVAQEFTKAQLTNSAKGFNAYFQAWSDASEGMQDGEKELADLRKQFASADLKDKRAILAKMDEVIAKLNTQKKVMETLAVTSKTAAEGTAAAIYATFAGLRDSGMSAAEAVKQIGPSVAALSSQMDKAGIKGGAAFNSLISMVNLLNDKVSGPVLEGLLGLGDALVGLHNSGMLTQEMFAGLTEQIGTTFERLIAQGYDGGAALQLMQPALQKIWELQQDFGYAVDASTQKMLDQGIAAGIVGDKHRSAQDLMAKGIERLVELMELYLQHMGIDLPAATDVAKSHIVDMGVAGVTAYNSATAAAQTFNQVAQTPLTQTHTIIERRVLEYQEEWAAGRSTAPNNNDMLSKDAFPDYESWLANWLQRNKGDEHRAREAYDSATGGIVPRYLDVGGMVNQVVKFVPRGTDRVPAMLTPNEGVLSANRGMANLAKLNFGIGPFGSQADTAELKEEVRSLRGDLAKVFDRLAGRDRDVPFKTALMVKSVLAKAS